MPCPWCDEQGRCDNGVISWWDANGRHDKPCRCRCHRVVAGNPYDLSRGDRSRVVTDGMGGKWLAARKVPPSRKGGEREHSG